MALDRRKVLRGAGLLGTAPLAGCFTASTAEKCGSGTYPPGGFRITNRDTDPHTVSIAVIRELLLYAETIFDRSYDLGSICHVLTINTGSLVLWVLEVGQTGRKDGDTTHTVHLAL